MKKLQYSEEDIFNTITRFSPSNSILNKIELQNAFQYIVEDNAGSCLCNAIEENGILSGTITIREIQVNEKNKTVFEEKLKQALNAFVETLSK